MIITIDGSAGTGKTTVARELASRLGYFYCDTGAIFRAITYLMLQDKVALSDEKTLSAFLACFSFTISSQSEGGYRYIANGIDVTQSIRLPSVTQNVSAVSALDAVRKCVLSIEKKIAERYKRSIFEGRDMGSVVFPEAPIKIFLTVRPEVAAHRRLIELKAQFPKETSALNPEQVIEEIIERDRADTERSIAPLITPSEAYSIDTSDLSIEQVIEQILSYIKVRSPSPRNKSKWIYSVVKWLAKNWMKYLYRLKIYGLGNQPVGAALLAANHASFLDPIVISASLPEEVHFLARKTLFQNRWFGYLIRSLNAHPIKRTGLDLDAFKCASSLLMKGNKVLLFPEGKRSQDGRLGPLKPGIAALARHTKAAIVPVYIKGTYQVWNRHKKRPHLFGTIKCVFGKPIFQTFSSSERKKEEETKLLHQLEEALRALEEWVNKGAKGIPP